MKRKTILRIGDTIAAATAAGGLLLAAHTAAAAPTTHESTPRPAAVRVVTPGHLPAYLRPLARRAARAQDRYEARSSTRNLRRAVVLGARFGASVSTRRRMVGGRCRIIRRRNGGAVIARCTTWTARSRRGTLAATVVYRTHEDASPRALRVVGLLSGVSR